MNAENLRALLSLYLFAGTRNHAVVAANEKQIEGVKDLRLTSGSRVASGLVIRGREIVLTLNRDHFAGDGVMYLFGSVLDHFLGSYANINCYTRLKVTDEIDKKSWEWPARLGDRPLI
jgi:type VI secretion system protein ImpG